MAITITPLDLGTVVLPDWHTRVTDQSCLILGYVVRQPDGVILFDTGTDPHVVDPSHDHQTVKRCA